MSTSDADTTRDDSWVRDWDPVVAAVGQDFAPGEVAWGADVVERGAIRRFLEPLEFDCALHTDPEVAAAHGHADVTMPASGVIAWTLPPTWVPGETLFDSDDRDSQPVRSAIAGPGLEIGPPTTGFFGTDVELDFLREVVAGERIGRRGRRLVSCRPKETGVGRGAFLVWESDVVSDRGDVVARFRVGSYAYVPKEDA